MVLEARRCRTLSKEGIAASRSGVWWRPTAPWRDDARRRVGQSCPRLGRGNRFSQQERPRRRSLQLGCPRSDVAAACAATSFGACVPPAEPGATLSDAPSRVGDPQITRPPGRPFGTHAGRAQPRLAATVFDEDSVQICYPPAGKRDWFSKRGDAEPFLRRALRRVAPAFGGAPTREGASNRVAPGSAGGTGLLPNRAAAQAVATTDGHRRSISRAPSKASRAHPERTRACDAPPASRCIE